MKSLSLNKLLEEYILSTTAIYEDDKLCRYRVTYGVELPKESKTENVIKAYRDFYDNAIPERFISFLVRHKYAKELNTLNFKRITEII
jgi:hypothetical protein